LAAATVTVPRDGGSWSGDLSGVVAAVDTSSAVPEAGRLQAPSWSGEDEESVLKGVASVKTLPVFFKRSSSSL
jgi:hypothetical protein